MWRQIKFYHGSDVNSKIGIGNAFFKKNKNNRPSIFTNKHFLHCHQQHNTTVATSLTHNNLISTKNTQHK